MDNPKYIELRQKAQGVCSMYSSEVERNCLANFHLAAEQTPAANIAVETPVRAEREGEAAAWA